MIKDNLVTYAATVGGMLLIAMGLIGFWFPGLVGMRLGLVVNVAHLVTGAAALYWGLNSRSVASLRVFCLGLGVLYGLAGAAALAVGGSGNTFTVLSWNLPVPGLGHLFHLLLGAGFAWAGMAQPSTTPQPHTPKPGSAS